MSTFKSWVPHLKTWQSVFGALTSRHTIGNLIFCHHGSKLCCPPCYSSICLRSLAFIGWCVHALQDLQGARLNELAITLPPSTSSLLLTWAYRRLLCSDLLLSFFTAEVDRAPFLCRDDFARDDDTDICVSIIYGILTLRGRGTTDGKCQFYGSLFCHVPSHQNLEPARNLLYLRSYLTISIPI